MTTICTVCGKKGNHRREACTNIPALRRTLKLTDMELDSKLQDNLRLRNEIADAEAQMKAKESARTDLEARWLLTTRVMKALLILIERNEHGKY